MIEHVFEVSQTAAGSLLDRICASARAENRAAAQGLASIDGLYRLRLREDGGHDDWPIDTIDQVAAEVAAALGISQGCGNAAQSVNNVTISGLTVSATPPAARVNGAIAVDAGRGSNVLFADIALKDNQQVPLYTSANVRAEDFTISGWTLDGNPVTIP